MVIKLGLNGFGRIGRVIFRAGFKKCDIEITAINDPAIDIEYICYLIKFDSTHGKFNATITHTKDEIFVNDLRIKIFHEKLPSNVPWQTASVQYVVEASGMFTTMDKASGHLSSDGVRRVIVTAPSVDVPMIIIGVNENELHFGQKVISCASSTLYCLAPIAKILDDSFGVAEGFVTSIHAMTPSLKPLDGLCLRGKHWRDHRSIHQNIIPASTSACRALSRVLPRLRDKLAGLAFRVPIVDVSVLDISIRLNKNTTLKEILEKVENANNTYMKNIIKISYDEAVSSDFSGETHSCVLDAASSLQLKTNFYKLVCWYENEFSYASRVLDSIFYSERQLLDPLPSIAPKPPKKQDSVQQTDACRNEIRGSVSQEIGIKSKTPSRGLLLNKQVLTQLSGNSQSFISNREFRKRNELLKILNDDKEKIQNSVTQNTNSLFQSCIAITPQTTESIDCVKAQERLNTLKKEFTKMVNITESLLKKSFVGNIRLNSMENTTKDGNLIRVNNSIEPQEENIESNDSTTCKRFNTVGDFKTEMVKPVPKIKNTESKFGINMLQFNTMMVRKCLDNQNKSVLCKNRNTQDKKLIDRPNKSNDPLVKDKNPPKNDKIQNKEHIIKCTEKLPSTDISKNLSYQVCLQVEESKTIQDEVKHSSEGSKDTDSGFSSIFIKNSATEIAKIDGSQSSDSSKFPNSIDNYNTTNDTQLDSDYDGISNNVENCITKQENEKSCSKVYKTKEDVTNNSLESHILQKNLLELNRISPESDHTSKFGSPAVSSMAASNAESYKQKYDIYDKLDSVSGTSYNSFQMNERKSQVITISDLTTTSLEDLARLDKICKIIEISDELSNELFSALDGDGGINIKKQKWSLKDLCERIKLDEFCDKIFGKSI